MVGSGESPLPGCRFYYFPLNPHMAPWQRAVKGSRLSCDFYKGTDPVCEALPS